MISGRLNLYIRASDGLATDLYLYIGYIPFYDIDIEILFKLFCQILYNKEHKPGRAFMYVDKRE